MTESYGAVQVLFNYFLLVFFMWRWGKEGKKELGENLMVRFNFNIFF